MISAPSGMSVGMPAPPAACADAPPPLFAGGGATASPLQSPLPGASSSAPSPTSAATAGAALVVAGGTPAGAAPAATSLAGAPSMSVLAAPGASGAPAAMAAATPAAAPAAAPARLTTLAPGARARDAELVEGTLAALRQSPAGAMLVDRLLAVGARVNVLSDQEFSSMGHGDAHAFFDPATDTVYLRRTNLEDPTRAGFAAVALAHEGTHLLDDVGRLADPWVEQAARRIHAAGGPDSPRGAEVKRQAMFELTMIKEARAFVFAGQVARDLGVKTTSRDPTTVAAAGGNDQATYDRVWRSLLGSSYNPDRRSAPPRNF